MGDPKYFNYRGKMAYSDVFSGSTPEEANERFILGSEGKTVLSMDFQETGRGYIILAIFERERADDRIPLMED